MILRLEELTEGQEILLDIMILRNVLVSKGEGLSSFELTCILVGIKMLCQEVFLLKCEVERKMGK